MKKKNTKELLDALAFANSIDDVLDNEFSHDTLTEYLHKLLIQKNLKKNQVIKKAELNTTFGYQIFNGERHATRNKLLQLIFAMELTVDEAQHLLTLAGVNPLYSRNRRDAILLYCLMQKKSLSETESLLFEQQEALICTD